MVNKNFGQLLRNYRKINQLTQQQVADALNINRTTYTYYETGKTEPNINTLYKLIKLFDVSYNDILPSDNNCCSLKELYLKSDNAFYNLTMVEQNLILHFRLLSNEEKIQYLEQLKMLHKEDN